MESFYSQSVILGTADGSIYTASFMNQSAYNILIKLQTLMSEVDNSVKSYETYNKSKIKGEVSQPEDCVIDLDLLLTLLDKPMQEQTDFCIAAMHRHDADAFN